MHLAYIWIVSHFSAKNWWKFDEVMTKTNLLSFLGHGVYRNTEIDFELVIQLIEQASKSVYKLNFKVKLKTS